MRLLWDAAGADQFAADLSKRGIRQVFGLTVNCVYPGRIERNHAAFTPTLKNRMNRL